MVAVSMTLAERLLALSLSKLAVWVYDNDHARIRWANREALLLWKANSVDELQERDYSGNSPATQARLDNYVRTIRNGEEVAEDWTLYPKGKPATMTLYGSAITLDDGRLAILFQAMPKDQTLEGSMVRGVEVLRHTSLMVSLFNEEGGELFHNPAVLREFGANTKLSSWLPTHWQEILRTVAAGESYQAELAVQVLSGQRWHIVEARPATDPVTGQRGMLLQQRDISKRRQAEELAESRNILVEELHHTVALVEKQVQERTRQLSEAKDAAESANRSKSAFLAMMSHEIRTPMNGVIGMTALLMGTRLTDDQQDYVVTIRNSGEALLAVINDILDFSKIESGRLDLEPHPFDLGECLESVLDLCALRAGQKKLDLCYLIAEQVPHGLIADSTRLRQILVNLIGNAVKFTERGEVSVAVGRLPQQPRKEPDRELVLQCSVRDTGIGIPPDRQARLFQSFSQVDASTTRKYGGTGLGLAISKRLVELMGGRMWVESSGIPGAGSTFHFTIQAELSGGTERGLLSERAAPLRGQRALVIEPSASVRQFVMQHLSAWGMSAQAVASLPAALDLMTRGTRFAVALLGHRCPDFRSLQQVNQLRQAAQGATPQLILMSPLGEVIPSGQEFSAVLHKPLKASRLLDVLLELLVADSVPRTSRSGISGASWIPQGAALPLRILLVEDNATNQKLARLLLERMGYRTDLAFNGLEAVQALHRQPYDVVLMDMQMPEMDGLEATRRIRSDFPAAQQPRIIAMTANALRGDRERCLQAGMDDYLSKPIRVEELRSALLRCHNLGTMSEGGDRSAEIPIEQNAFSQQEKEYADLEVAAQERLRRVTGNDAALMRELLDTFLQDAEDLLASAKHSLEINDLDPVHRAFHSMKANAGELGASALHHEARELEHLAKHRRCEDLRERLPGFSVQVQQACIALKRLRDRLTD